MIISASYKTDIPAWYGDWFINRLRAGSCTMTNPYNNALHTVALTREAVDGFVFWTRDIRPFLPRLDEVRDRGFPFIVHHGLMGYPRPLERTQVAVDGAVTAMHTLAREYHPRVAIWRYDPVLFTSLTPYDWHLKNFRELAAKLEGAVDEVVLSFAQVYKKTERNLDRAAREHGFEWHDPEDEVKCELAAELAIIAAGHGMQLALCAQTQYVVSSAVSARCIDPFRLSDVAGYVITAPRKPHRPNCGCYQSRDIGAYNTCPHGCAYCYAVASCEAARERYRNHDPEAARLS